MGERKLTFFVSDVHLGLDVKDKEGRDVFLADSGYVLSMAQQDFEHIQFHFTIEF